MSFAEKKVPPLTLLFSVLAHLALLFLIGGIVLVQGIVPKQSFLAELPSEESPMPEVPLDTPTDESSSAESPMATDSASPSSETAPTAFDISAITTESTSTSFNMSSSVGAVGVGSMPGGYGGGGTGEGTGEGHSGAKRIKLFSAEVETNKMGVLMDVSGSAAAYIVPALKEVEKNFKDAPIVFVGGCGIGKNVTNREVEVGKIRGEKEGVRPDFLPLLKRISDRYQSKEIKDQLAHLGRQDNLWGVYITGGLKDSTITTRYGFDQLIKEKVDSIYWFADFTDKVDPEEMQELTKILKEKNIKLIAHNFSGTSVPALQTEMAQQTGGTTIRVKPEPAK